MSSSCAFVMAKRPPLLPCLQCLKKGFTEKWEIPKQRSFSLRLIDTYDDDVVSWETFQRPSFQRRLHTSRFSLVKQKGTTRKKKRVKSHTYVQIIPSILNGVVFKRLLFLFWDLVVSRMQRLIHFLDSCTRERDSIRVVVLWLLSSPALHLWFDTTCTVRSRELCLVLEDDVVCTKKPATNC
jgi:hypothetical protein